MKRIIALMAMVACGLSLFLYPQASRWYSLRSDYGNAWQTQNAERRQTPLANNAMLEAAHAYNEKLSQQPFAIYSEAGALADIDYQAQLRSSAAPSAELADTGAAAPGGAVPSRPAPAGAASLFPGVATPSEVEAMARVSIPKVDITIPVYHGTSETALMMGAGHIYGTSLPVGGPSTHTVITAHSRQGQTNRFTRIRELEVGDEFMITAAGQTMRYVVDQIKTVMPSEVDDLQIVPGEDHATLLTCTPLGLNTHRLLVRGIRADLPTTGKAAPEPAPLPFPWWAVWLGGGVVASGVAGWLIDKKMAVAPAAGGAPVCTCGANVARPAKSGAKAKTKTTAKNSTAKPRSAASNPARKSATATKPKPVARRTGHGRHVAKKGSAR